MTFPLAKLGFLLLKQLSKPLANIIKNEAKEHPMLRKYFCIPPARVYHWMEMRTKIKMKHRWQKITYAPLTEEEEVELGANLLGEIILFGMLSIILLFEFGRQSDKRALQKRMLDEEKDNLITMVLEMSGEISELKACVRKLSRSLDAVYDDFMDFEDAAYDLQDDRPPEQRVHDDLKTFWTLPFSKRRRASRMKKYDIEYESVS